MKKQLLTYVLGITPWLIFSQVTFTDSSSSLVNSNLTSGVAIGVCDMNGDGLDDIVRLDDASDLEIEYQAANGTFSRLDYGNIGSGSEWGMCIADIDKNGYNDIIAGGVYNSIKVLTANGSGTGYSLSNLNSPAIFVQNMNFADIDNDGTIDIFSCHDDGISSPYKNNGAGSFTYDLTLINTASTVPSDNSGNYGSIWTDYDNDGDLDLYISKCRLGVNNPNDGRRLNLLFQNDGSGNFTEVAPSSGLQPKAQSWAAAFEDIDNDEDLDCVLVNHDMTSMIFRNNGDATFTDITASSGIATELAGMGSDGIQVIMEDFDNDGFVDIFITSRGADHYLFKNDGDNTFTEMPTPFPGTPDDIQSAAIGDLNNDGFVDVVAGFANGYNGPSSDPDMLFLNNGNSNNWSKVRLTGTTSNISGLGAKVKISGSWGVQTREVRAGESYGIMNSLISHFGIGSATAISQIEVIWPSGTVDVILNPDINEQIDITEGETLSNPDISANELKLFPNPATNNVTITSNQTFDDYRLELFDITGKRIDLTETTATANEIQLNVSQLQAGLYFVRLNQDGKESVFRLIKQ